MDHAGQHRKSTKGASPLKKERENKSAEFLPGVADQFSILDLPQISRKKFLALMSASAAFTLTGCSNYRDRGEIVPYRKKPEDVQPGISMYYASSCDECPQLCGILVKAREGRPVKIDGNPDHPVNLGKICAKGQASILNLYDPYRLRAPLRRNGSGVAGEVTWESADREIIGALSVAAAEGKEIAIVTHTVHSPTAKKIFGEFATKFPTAKFYSYDLFHDRTRAESRKVCYGSRDMSAPAWEKAKVVFCLEADILGTEGMTVEQIRKITARRSADDLNDFMRLYCAEGPFTLTGANADYRFPLRPEAQTAFLAVLASEILRRTGGKRSRIDNITGGAQLDSFCRKHNLNEKNVELLINDLLNHKGGSVVYAGNALPVSAHILVNYLNEILGNQNLFSSIPESAVYSVRTSAADFSQLTDRLKSDSVGAVVHYGTNPVYHLTPAFNYEDALKNVPLSVSLTESENETSGLCTFALPAHHALESWGDFSVRRGVYSLRQPIIAPLYNSRQKESVLLTWMNGAGFYRENIFHEYLMRRWEKEIYPVSRAEAGFKPFWYSSLHDGVILVPEPESRSPRFDPQALEKVVIDPESSELTLILTESHFIGDGRFANNGWMQELPDPVSKVVWDNYAAVSPVTARALELENSDLVEVKSRSGSVTVPALIQPGQTDGCVSISLGYGRRNAGPIGNDVGVNVNPLLDPESLFSSRIFTGVSMKKTGTKGQLVTTQEHHSLDDEFVKDFHLKRRIIQEGTTSGYRKNPHFLQHKDHKLTSITKGIEYSGVKWAMAIDLSRCTGCSACVAGCNVENNIPVVGKEQVAVGREMQWLRIDRYYSGTDADPQVSYQPMLCQHCDNAPCENVCPVVATNHSPDGLNQMVYNRCVGTKYCSNNCPYKVRRFNFSDWRDYLAGGYYEKEPVSLLYNPEVTLRSRGVMEKCTFCIQRIAEARQSAAAEGRQLRGTDVRTACQDACPASAIVFGDMNDSGSDVSECIRHGLGYRVLEETNVRPNITYLAKIRNIRTDDQA